MHVDLGGVEGNRPPALDNALRGSIARSGGWITRQTAPARALEASTILTSDTEALSVLRGTVSFHRASHRA